MVKIVVVQRIDLVDVIVVVQRVVVIQRVDLVDVVVVFDEMVRRKLRDFLVVHHVGIGGRGNSSIRDAGLQVNIIVIFHKSLFVGNIRVIGRNGGHD